LGRIPGAAILPSVAASISPALIERLRCPATGQPLVAKDEALATADGKHRYPVSPDGIPDLFVASRGADQARTEAANSEFHDGHAAEYDRLTVRPEEDYFEVSRVLEELTRAHGNARDLLDAGCGSGVVLKRAKPLFKSVLGIDVSLGMLRRCLPIHRDLVRASVFALPLDGASVDAVTGYSLLHHLHDPGEAFREFHRVLRPGGFLYTDNDSNRAFHERFGWWLKIRRAAKEKRARTEADQALEKAAECHHDTGLDPAALKSALSEAGFSRVEVRYAHPPRPDEFTKLLLDLERHEPSESLRYYFKLVAWK
jgi:ubiquinone/menaquinone biosynthesis C-methylase UbiE